MCVREGGVCGVEAVMYEMCVHCVSLRGLTMLWRGREGEHRPARM